MQHIEHDGTYALSTFTGLRSKRCVWVTPVLGVHGRLLYFGPILRCLAAQFADFRVLTGQFDGDLQTAGFQIELTGGYRKLYRDDRVAGPQSGRYVSGVSVASPAILRRIFSLKPDLVIINEFSLYCFYAALSRLLDRHTRLLCIAESRPQLQDQVILSHLRKSFRRVLARLPDQFLTNNQAGHEYLTGDLAVPDAQVLASPYLVSELSGPPAASRKAPGVGQPVVFVYAGDLVKRKGIHIALEALGRLDKNLHGRFEFRLAGDGPYRAELEAHAERLGLGQRVRFLGRIPYDQMVGLYDSADVFLFPTLGDYRALSPFEAMSRGLAIVSSIKDGGHRESVDEGRNGFTFDPADTVGLAARLSDLLDHPERIAEYSATSLKMAQGYTLKVGTGNLIRACGRALSMATPLSGNSSSWTS